VQDTGNAVSQRRIGEHQRQDGAASSGTALPASLCRKAAQRFMRPSIQQNARVFRPGRLCLKSAIG